MCIFTSEDGIGAFDIIVGFPLLQLPPQVTSKYSNIKTWLDNVKIKTQPWSSKLQDLGTKAEGEKKKDSKKKDNSKAKPQEEKKRKLRVLCIHGYRQNAKTSKEKLGSFRKLIAKFADLDFITAPHLIPSDLPEEQVITFLLTKNKLNLLFRISMVGGSVSLVEHLMPMRTLTVI